MKVNNGLMKCKMKCNIKNIIYFKHDDKHLKILN